MQQSATMQDTRQVRIIFVAQGSAPQTESTQSVTFDLIQKDNSEESFVSMSQFFEQLKKPIQDKVKNQMVSFFCSKMGCYIYIGIYKPNEKDAKVEFHFL